jgi:molecular chaperone DnaK (HSP70)
MAKWAMDLGTTNTGIARWDEAADKPRLVELSALCRQPSGEDPLQAPRLIPSATHLLDELSFWTRFCQRPFLMKRTFVGKYADIGRRALERNETKVHPNFVPMFKGYLGREPLRPIGRVGKRPYSAREVARIFVRELLAEVKRTEKERIRDLVITTPVDAYETYRAELTQLSKALGIKRLRFIDEPVAAALGYGLGLGNERLVLVVDFGGGTLDIALVSITAHGIREGGCKVIAKAGRNIGGNLVDSWLLDAFCEEMHFKIDEAAHDWERGFWYRLALAEARRVKEGLFFQPEEVFRLTPPDSMRSFEARTRGPAEPVRITKERVIDILTEHRMYEDLQGCLAEVLEHASGQGISNGHIHDVLMVGGSTLLPNVYSHFIEQFGRDRVRAFQPFEAVAYGACAFAAEHFTQSDYIVHDYAFVTHDPRTHEEKYIPIIPAGTRFPTEPTVWRRQLVPTCSLGEPERIFKLVIYEQGKNSGEERRFTWDDDGNIHALGGSGAKPGAGEPVRVALNKANPTLGYLDPPHPPSDRTPRLDIAFGVNADRWLIATVQDLKTGKKLMNGEPVVRLL